MDGLLETLGKFSINQVNFMKTQAKFCQNSSRILKNSIYRKFQLHPLPQKGLKNKPGINFRTRSSLADKNVQVLGW